MAMYVRSKDGRRLTEAHSVELSGKSILVNGDEFAVYGKKEEALEAFRALCKECADIETFYDLSGEIIPEDDFDDDDDDDDDDDEDNGGNGGYRFLYQ